MVWVKFHDKLCTGGKRGLPRSVRFVFMELCLATRPERGGMDLPVGMPDIDGLHDVLGGSRKEIVDAMKLLTVVPRPTADDPEPRAMVELTGEEGARRLTIPSWSAWNSGHETPGASTERSRRHRQQRPSTESNDAQRTGTTSDATQATVMQRPLHTDATVVQRTGNGPATQYRGEERREEEKRDPPYPPQAGEAGESPDVPEPTKKARKAKGDLTPSEQAYSKAYVAGQLDAEPGYDFRPLTASACRLIGAAAATHAKGPGGKLTGDALLAWIRATSAEYRRAADPRFNHGFAAYDFGVWLDGGRPITRGEPLPSPPLPPRPAREPPPPRPMQRMSFEDQRAKQQAAVEQLLAERRAQQEQPDG